MVLQPLLVRTSPQSVYLRFQLPAAAEAPHAQWNLTLEALRATEGSSQQDPQLIHLLTQPRASVLPEVAGMMLAHRCGLHVSDNRKSGSIDSGALLQCCAVPMELVVHVANHCFEKHLYPQQAHLARQLVSCCSEHTCKAAKSGDPTALTVYAVYAVLFRNQSVRGVCVADRGAVGCSWRGP